MESDETASWNRARDRGRRFAAGVRAAALLALLPCWLAVNAAAQQVLTYHNDTLRTGWDQHETALTAASVGGAQFGLQQSVMLDEQVDTQPLVVKRRLFAGQAGPFVVYVATANDSVYAIDGTSGAVLASRSLGTPLPQSALPGQCWNNSASVGVDSTPVIDPGTGTIYLIAATYENGAAVLRLHALSLVTFADQVPAVTITASQTLTDGTTFTLDPSSTRQRAALLLSGGNVYAGFASYCDINADRSRGWLLGWNATTLAPLAANRINDRLATSPDNFFLSSIWMSGYGPATAKPNSPIYFTTGNSDYSGTTYNAQTNLSESLTKMAPDLSRALSHFTPGNVAQLDENDTDFGAGGAMVLPAQPGQTPDLVAAAGKDGNLYLIDRNHMNGPPLGTYPAGGCWCGPSYFVGADGQARIVSSGADGLTSWVLHTAPTQPASLTQEFQTPISSGQDRGFFTSVSSNGTLPGTAVIWAISRPTDSDPADISLYAVDPATGNVIFDGVAGTWPNVSANDNSVPVVAGGHVYVASYKELAIFGLGDLAPPPARQALLERRATAVRAARFGGLVLQQGQHAIAGRLLRIDQSVLTLRERDGTLLHADIAAAQRADAIAVPVVGRAELVLGRYAPDGVLRVDSMQRLKDSPALWPPDR